MVDSCRATHRDGISYLLALNISYQCTIWNVYRYSYLCTDTCRNTPFEVLLSHVSQPWRVVSLTTRKLWNHIDIYTPHSLVTMRHKRMREGRILVMTPGISEFKSLL
jgi:hypothetical protein